MVPCPSLERVMHLKRGVPRASRRAAAPADGGSRPQAERVCWGGKDCQREGGREQLQKMYGNDKLAPTVHSSLSMCMLARYCER